MILEATAKLARGKNLMLDIETLRNNILYLMCKSEQSVKRGLQSKNFLKLFETDELALFIAKEFVSWYQQYSTKPSPKRIDEQNSNSKFGASLHVRLKLISDIDKQDPKPTENEFESYLDDLKMAWMKEKVNSSLMIYANADVSKIEDVSKLSKSIKGFGNEFVKISDAVAQDDEGEYSYTTEEVAQNIEVIKNKDLTNVKRFSIGHRIFDNATKGVRYGDLVMFLGNVNTGKSMVLTNVVYNLWKSGANVLLLTCEMKPNEFDERIYSRATNIEYDAIINGKDAITENDKAAFDAYIVEVGTRPNKIVTKFLKTTDNVGTVDNYIEDLKLKRDFIPDVVVVDSLEHISPLYPNVEDKDNLKVAQIITEFKDYAQTFMNSRGLVIISTHQAKTDTFDKNFEDISIVDFGRSKVAAEKPDFALYIRSKAEINTMNVKLIKARRTAAGLTWAMAIDFSKCLVQDTQDSLNSEMLTGD